MKALKIIGVTLLGLAALICIIGFISPGKGHIERSIIIKTSPENAFEQVNNLKNWDNWATWNQMDPNWKRQFVGPERGVGSAYSWESENSSVGSGRMEVKQSVPNDSVVIELSLMGGPPSKGIFNFSSQPDGEHIKWAMEFDMGMNPLHRLIGNFMDAMAGPDFEKGLANMKTYLEAHSDTSSATH